MVPKVVISEEMMEEKMQSQNDQVVVMHDEAGIIGKGPMMIQHLRMISWY
jgi:hypothetical protein